MAPIVILIVILIVTFALLAYFLSKKPTTVNLGPAETFDITTVTNVSSELLNSPNWTMSFFIYPIAKSQVIDSYITIVNNDKIKLEVSGLPTSSSIQNALIQLSVTDKASPPITNVTPIQSLPYQKWTYVSMVRDSMRITIYYNGKAVFSKIYDTLQPSSVINLGNSSSYIGGKFANLSITGTSLTINEIQANYDNLADTNGKPYSAYSYKFPNPSDIFSMKLSTVLPKMTMMEASTPPPGSQWKRPYE